MARITVDPGFTLHCDVDDYLWPWQGGTPVVMIHGFARNATFWRGWIPALSAEHRVYRPELRGFGRSDVPPDGFAFDGSEIVSDLVKVLDHFGIEKAHFVGESSGGVFSVLFALNHPERVQSLVLCDTPLKAAHSSSETYTLGEATTGAALRKFGVAEWCRRTLKHRLDLENSPRELQEWYITEMGKSPSHMAAALNDLVRISPPLTPLVKQLTMPVLLLAGDQSTISASQQETFARELPNAKLHTFKGYGHAVNVVLPEECAREALAFWGDT